MDSIIAMVERLEHAGECKNDDCKETCQDHDGQEGIDCYHDEDKAREAITEDALEVATSKEFDGSRRFMVLLCTGGPAVRIIGELDEHNQPDRAWLEYQDWGTPWTEYYGDNFNREALLTYSGQFYFDNE